MQSLRRKLTSEPKEKPSRDGHRQARRIINVKHRRAICLKAGSEILSGGGLSPDDLLWTVLERGAVDKTAPPLQHLPLLPENQPVLQRIQISLIGIDSLLPGDTQRIRLSDPIRDARGRDLFQFS